MAIGTAFRAFFGALINGETSKRIDAALAGKPAAETKKIDAKPTQLKPKPPARSEAVTLLSTLQREARLIDLIQESLDGYSDEQVGAAAREVLRDSQKALGRMFGLQPLIDGEEGSTIQLPENASANRYRINGAADSQSGQLAHAGWLATRVELPKWTGKPDDAMILAPAEIDA